jgi:ribonucleoside-diphosphate reductase alpha chain/ribonucleoside-diphosphate reductase subunit M1
MARQINQGGKRKGSIACYLEMFHPDIFDFIELFKHVFSFQLAFDFN